MPPVKFLEAEPETGVVVEVVYRGGRGREEDQAGVAVGSWNPAPADSVVVCHWLKAAQDGDR